MIEDKKQEKPNSGIIVPPSKEEKDNDSGIVVATGDRIKEDIRVGDEVLYHNAGAIKITHNNQSYKMLKEDKLIGIIKYEI